MDDDNDETISTLSDKASSAAASVTIPKGPRRSKTTVLEEAASFPIPQGQSARNTFGGECGVQDVSGCASLPPSMIKTYSDVRKNRALSLCKFGVAVMSPSLKAPVAEVLSRITQLCGGRMQEQWLDAAIFQTDPELWPPCDILWTLWSSDLPLEKLKAYVDRVEPMELNEVTGLLDLRDRSKTLRECVKWGIPVPRFLQCDRDGSLEPSIIDHEDYILIDGQRLDKPFVEKPIRSVDRDIYVYYPRSAGGGRVRLGWQGWGDAEFLGGRAYVRRNGSYVYECFIPSEGFELRLGVVGSSYVNAEAKQQLPVSRSCEQSMPQFIPVSLEPGEKQLARKAALAFGQRTFNLFALRTQHRCSGTLGADQKRKGDDQRNVFVHDIDVENGGIPSHPTPALIEDIARNLLDEIRNHRSYSKRKEVLWSLSAASGSSRRWNKARAGSKNIGLRQQTDDSNPRSVTRVMSWPAINGSQADGEEDDPDLFDYDPFEDLPEEESLMSPKVSGTETERLDAQRRKTVQVGVLQRGTSSLSSESQASLHEPDLLAVLAVLRHGDRTPKQKVKLKLQVAGCVEDPRFFLGMLIGSILGTDMALRVRTVQVGAFDLRSSEQMRRLHDLLQAVRVEECKPKDAPREASDGPVVTNTSQPSLPIEPDSPENKDGTKSAPADVLDARPDLKGKPTASGLVSKSGDLLAAACNALKKFSDVHAKIEAEKDLLKVSLKWGGELTRVGEMQAKGLGKKFKQSVYSSEDMAHMHASLRHDLKVHSSNEPRCAQTAAAFAQGLLSLDCPLPAVQVSFVRMDGLGRLDLDGHTRKFKHSELMEPAKERSRALLESGDIIDDKFEKEVLCVPQCFQRVQVELENCRQNFGTVRTALEKLASAVEELEQELKLASGHTKKHTKLQETLPLIRQRWDDFVKDLKGEPKRVPPEMVADILDHAKYDMRHSMPILEAAGSFDELNRSFRAVYSLSSSIASYAELGEYGTNREEKFEIARAFLRPMLRKLRWDLRVASGAELGEEEEHVRRHNELFQPMPSSPKGEAAVPAEPPVRSRLYFAHHSQMQTLINLFRWADEPGACRFLSPAGEHYLSRMPLPLGYLCHLVLKLWRHPDEDDNNKRYMVRLEFSPGDEGSSTCNAEAPVADGVILHEGIPLTELDKFLSELLTEEDRKI